MKINEKLKYLLKTENISAAAFGRETAIAESTVGHYVNGRTQPTHAALEKICSHPRFKKYTMFLMTGDESESIDSLQTALDSGEASRPDEQELAQKIEELPEELRNQVDTYIEFLVSQQKER